MDKLDKKKKLITSSPHLLLPHLKGSCAAKDSDKSSYNDQSSLHCELQKLNSNGLRQKGKTLVHRMRKNRVGSGPQTQLGPGIQMRLSKLSSFSFPSHPFPSFPFISLLSPVSPPPTHTHTLSIKSKCHRESLSVCQDIVANTLDPVKLMVQEQRESMCSSILLSWMKFLVPGKDFGWPGLNTCPSWANFHGQRMKCYVWLAGPGLHAKGVWTLKGLK